MIFLKKSRRKQASRKAPVFSGISIDRRLLHTAAAEDTAHMFYLFLIRLRRGNIIRTLTGQLIQLFL